MGAKPRKPRKPGANHPPRDGRPAQIRSKLPGVVEKCDEMKREIWHRFARQGQTTAVIAEEMGLKFQKVADLKSLAWKEACGDMKETTGMYRASETDRMLGLIEKWTKAAESDPQAANIVIKCSTQIAKMHGCEQFKVALSDADGKNLLPKDFYALIAYGTPPPPKRAELIESTRIE